jgi:toxin HigB-1
MLHDSLLRVQRDEKVWNLEFSKKLPPDIQQRALRKLYMLQRAVELRDLAVPPSNHLEQLHGERMGQHSIRINNQWRICFVWDAGNATAVEIVDYHS